MKNENIGWIKKRHGYYGPAQSQNPIRIVQTFDGGNNWNSVPFPFSLDGWSQNAESNSAWIIDENNRWATHVQGIDHYLTKYNKHTNEWELLYYSTEGGPYLVYFSDSNIGWFLGRQYFPNHNSYICMTVDGGFSWKLQQFEPSDNYYSLAQVNDFFSLDSKSCWAVGNDGLIMKYTENPTKIIAEDEKVTSEIILSQNYPNPFNPIAKIDYYVPIKSFIKLKIFDVLGNEIKTLVNSSQSVGKYKVEFDGSDLSSGIYFYRLQAGDFVETKKMILLK